MVVSCVVSQVTVVLDDVPSVDGWTTARIMAESVANIVVGALGFSLGSGYSVEILQVTEQDGTPHVFGVRPVGEKPGQTLGMDPYIPAFNRATLLSVEDAFFRFALRDYLRAITEINDCATYCYRAIEGIKSAFEFKTGTDGWDEMHSTLGTEHTVIKNTVKQYADAVRHADWKKMKLTTGMERWRMLWLTRDILVKYMDYAEPAT